MFVGNCQEAKCTAQILLYRWKWWVGSHLEKWLCIYISGVSIKAGYCSFACEQALLHWFFLMVPFPSIGPYYTIESHLRRNLLKPLPIRQVMIRMKLYLTFLSAFGYSVHWTMVGILIGCSLVFVVVVAVIIGYYVQKRRNCRHPTKGQEEICSSAVVFNYGRLEEPAILILTLLLRINVALMWPDRHSSKLSIHACNTREILRIQRNGNYNISLETLSKQSGGIFNF